MPEGSESVRRPSEFRNGWLVLLACTLGQAVGFHTLPPFTTGLFIAPLGEEFGWSRTSVSIGVTIATIGTAVSAPIAGAIINILGERALIAFSTMIVAGGYTAMSLMGASVATYWMLLTAMALLGVGCTPLTLSRLVVANFDRFRGAAIGITLIGTGLASALPPLILGPVMSAYGWRAGFATLAAMVAIVWPTILALVVLSGSGKPNEPPAQHKAPRWLLRHLRDPLLLRLLVSFFCVAIATGGAVVHFAPMLIDTGYPLPRATEMASLIGASLIVSRLLTGVALDRIFAPRIAVAMMGLSAVGFFLLPFGGAAAIPYVAVLIGMSLGTELDLLVYLTSRYFPADVYGRAFGLLYASFLVGAAISPVIYAQLRETAGDYSFGFIWAAVLLAVSTLLFASLPRFPK
jgi:predicted MFS family arabinose efflux permease